MRCAAARALLVLTCLAPAPATGDELSAEDRALLEELELLVDWELLREWDPAEDLPIPLEAPPAPPQEPDPAGGEDAP